MLTRPAPKARCRCPDGDAPGHSHDRERDVVVDSFKAVDDPRAHRWAISDGPYPADASKGYEARCDRCGLHVVAMVRRAVLTIDAALFVAGYRINGAIHVVTPASREPYSASKHGRCAPR